VIEWSALLLNGAWPVLMAYAVYRVVLALGVRKAHRADLEILVAGVGGAIAWWGRVLYTYDLALEWPFALTVVGVALMLAPKFVGLAVGTWGGAHADADS
jgi:hypothetical protein